MEAAEANRRQTDALAAATGAMYVISCLVVLETDFPALCLTGPPYGFQFHSVSGIDILGSIARVKCYLYRAARVSIVNSDAFVGVVHQCAVGVEAVGRNSAFHHSIILNSR